MMLTEFTHISFEQFKQILPNSVIKVTFNIYDKQNIYHTSPFPHHLINRNDSRDLCFNLLETRNFDDKFNTVIILFIIHTLLSVTRKLIIFKAF